MDITVNDNGLSQRLREPVKFVRAMARAGQRLKRAAERFVPVRTGRLRRSFVLRVEDAGKRLALTNTQKYHKFVNNGTRYMTGRRYMERALDSERAGINKDFTEVLGEHANYLGGR